MPEVVQAREPLSAIGVLGVILAARDPLSNCSLIWFTVVCSLVQGAIMALQSFGVTEDMNHTGHLTGDDPALGRRALTPGRRIRRFRAASAGRRRAGRPAPGR
jgi:hypothetical protein